MGVWAGSLSNLLSSIGPSGHNAKNAKQNAKNAKQNAKNAKQNAKNAKMHEQNAKNAKQNAKNAKQNAKNAKTHERNAKNAKTHEQNAKTHTPREPLIYANKTVSRNSSKQYPIPLKFPPKSNRHCCKHINFPF